MPFTSAVPWHYASSLCIFCFCCSLCACVDVYSYIVAVVVRIMHVHAVLLLLGAMKSLLTYTFASKVYLYNRCTYIYIYTEPYICMYGIWHHIQPTTERPTNPPNDNSSCKSNNHFKKKTHTAFRPCHPSLSPCQPTKKKKKKSSVCKIGKREKVGKLGLSTFSILVCVQQKSWLHGRDGRLAVWMVGWPLCHFPFHDLQCRKWKTQATNQPTLQKKTTTAPTNTKCYEMKWKRRKSQQQQHQQQQKGKQSEWETTK